MAPGITLVILSLVTRLARSDPMSVAAAVLVLSLGAADASWHFDSTAGARLDYGDVPVVTSGAAGSFSCFCTVRLDAVEDDQFLGGKLGAAARGWNLEFDRTIGATDHERRFRFHVANGPGEETERYAVAEAAPDTWYAVGGSYTWNEAAEAGATGDDAADMHLYVDGVDASETPRFDTGRRPAEVNDPLTLGASPAAGAESTGARVGHFAVWGACALTPAEHLLLAEGADPRTIRPDCLTFYASLEDLQGEDLVGGALPQQTAGAAFSVDRYPFAKPLVTGLGDVRPAAIRLMSHAGRPATHAVEYTATDFPGTVSAPVAAAAETDFVAAHELTGLAPGTTYRYRVLVDGAVVPATVAEFTTAPAGDRAAFTFTYASCSEYSFHQPPYARYPFDAMPGIVTRAPDFLVHSGDVWYADNGGFNETDDFDAWVEATVEAFSRKARETLGLKEFAALQARLPVYSMPDDHEWRNNVSNIPGMTGTERDRADMALGRILAWQFQRNPPRLPKAVEDDGLWYSFAYGGVDFFFIDVRTQRSSNTAPDDPDKKMLGPDDRQLADLLVWLESSTAPFRIILSPGMISPFGTTGLDAWGVGFTTDAERVTALLAEHDDVVFFAGDVHWSGAIRVAAHASGNPAHDLYEFVGAPYAGHLSPPPAGGPEEGVLFTYDGRVFDPPRTSYLEVSVDTTRVPATLDVAVISFDRATGTERVEYAHPTLRSRRTCPGDIDRDGVVGFVDLVAVLTEWGVCDPETPCAADADGDGTVGVLDLLTVLAIWGPCR